MGSGMCSRRQKGLLQTGFFLVALACLGSGAFLYNHLQQKVKEAEAVAVKYKQQQEVLSAQLQVVYEHRSRLERSLQKERGEHKKTKEDFLVFLSSMHNQHEEIKKQLLDLQLQHNGLKLEHRKAVEAHNQKYSQLQREKESEVVGLQGRWKSWADRVPRVSGLPRATSLIDGADKLRSGGPPDLWTQFLSRGSAAH
uniref:Golgi integral membrane protein 4 n=1 Tax=Varanus komodoensis TaxID=61221 RepID=A0A8D2LE15_VARKO